jgi:sucrose-6-phosphate hydrolase SacC (GH32 family)
MFLPVPSAGEEARLAALSAMELKSATAEIEVRFRAKLVHLAISDGTEEILAVAFDPNRSGQELQIGDIAIHVTESGLARHHLRIFLDGSVAECFLDDQSACTYRTYRAPKAKLRIQIPQAELGAVESLQVWPLRPISPDRLTS